MSAHPKRPKRWPVQALAALENSRLLAQRITYMAREGQLAQIEKRDRDLSICLADMREASSQINEILLLAYYGEYREDEYLQAPAHDGSSGDGI